MAASPQTHLHQYDPAFIETCYWSNSTANQEATTRKTALDGLTIKEQERYKQLENIAIGLVGLNKTWDEVKGVLLLA